MKKSLFIGLLLLFMALSTWGQGRYCPGDVIPEPYLKVFGYEQFFSFSPIPEPIRIRMEGCSYKAMGGVQWDDLRYLQVLHCDADGNTIVGELVCHKSIAEDLMEIFVALYQAGYPIEKMRLVEEYGGDDQTSMCDNNTSCFNQRLVPSGGTISKHSYGMAIDINPRYNPYYLKRNEYKTIIEPPESAEYLDRTADFPYKIVKGDLCYRLFRKHGFYWGGDWTKGKDYQHFHKH
jgi:hypothetical protein